MANDLLFKTMNAVHRVALRLTGGRIGWHVAKMPVLELTTTGRKTGTPRTVLLTSPVQLGSTYVVVASRGGDDKHPAWYLNLLADSRVSVSVGGKPARPMEARVAAADEREKLWPKITTDYQNYADYQSKTERQIPLVLLVPSTPDSAA